MSSGYKHWAVEKSWWHGTVTTACGLVLTKPERASWFATECPACRRIRKQLAR
ncbi:hypothetical protein SAMN05661093_04979 [Kibdelosporangium aridum]|uniref:Uncharacterized protein n=1 Tax=Kibdelosporangium aridum TaxID=2030 RepID=A0A1W2EWU6_KIBAR|nr:hypothetical protein SAMN05661093_04979 [Kibdelosporangium aridum]